MWSGVPSGPTVYKTGVIKLQIRSCDSDKAVSFSALWIFGYFMVYYFKCGFWICNQVLSQNQEDIIYIILTF